MKEKEEVEKFIKKSTKKQLLEYMMLLLIQLIRKFDNKIVKQQKKINNLLKSYKEKINIIIKLEKEIDELKKKNSDIKSVLAKIKVYAIAKKDKELFDLIKWDSFRFDLEELKKKLKGKK